MTARQDDFLALYSRYRLGRGLGENDEQARRARWRQVWLVVSASGLFAASAVAEALVAGKVAVTIGAVLALACAAAGLALITGVVASASAAAEVTKVHGETDAALARLIKSRPGPDADERNVTDWVRRVEGALGQGEPGPDPPVAS